MNEKWLTDVTEFKCYAGTEVKKVYLSVILDLYDRRILVYKIETSNNNLLVFETFDKATQKNSDAHHCSIVTEDFSSQTKFFTTN